MESFSASRVEKHMACHASANLEKAIPGFEFPVVDPDKGAKGRGTELHAAIASVISTSRSEFRMLMQALQYFEEIRMRRNFNVLAEETFQASWTVSKSRTIPDAVLYLQDELHVFDWKFGRIEVDVWKNKQLLFALATVRDLAPKAKEYTIHIVQPPADNMASYVVSKEELDEFIRDARAADTAIQAGDVSFGPSDKACQFCSAFPHSRGDKGRPLCPVTLEILYPSNLDEDEVLSL